MDRFLSTYNDDDDGDEEEWAVSVVFGSNHGLVEDEIGPKGYCVEAGCAGGLGELAKVGL